MQRLAVFDFNRKRVDVRMMPASRHSWNDSFTVHQGQCTDCNLHYVVSGRFDIEREGRRTTASAGDLALSFSGDHVSYHLVGPIDIIHCHFSFAGVPGRILTGDITSWGAGIGSADHGLESLLILPDILPLHDCPEAIRLLEELPKSHKPKEPSGILLGAASLLRLLSLVSRSTLGRLSSTGAASELVGRHAHVRQAIEVIARRLAEPIAVREVAEELGIDADYLGRLFRVALGTSIGGWIMRSRLARARQLLADSSLSIKAVASAVGYADQLYFTRIFRREMRITPRDWRKAQGQSGYAPDVNGAKIRSG